MLGLTSVLGSSGLGEFYLAGIVSTNIVDIVVESNISIVSDVAFRNTVIRITVTSSIGVSETEGTNLEDAESITSNISVQDQRDFHINPSHQSVTSNIVAATSISFLNDITRQSVISSISVTSTASLFTGYFTVSHPIVVSQSIERLVDNVRLSVTSNVLVSQVIAARNTNVRLAIQDNIQIPTGLFFAPKATINPNRQLVRHFITIATKINEGNSNREIEVATEIIVAQILNSNINNQTITSGINVVSQLAGGIDHRPIHIIDTIHVSHTASIRNNVIHIKVTSNIHLNDNVIDQSPIVQEEIVQSVHIKTTTESRVVPHAQFQNNIIVTQTIIGRISPNRQNITDNIQLSQSMHVSPINLSVTSNIQVTDRARLTEITVHHFINVSQKINRKTFKYFVDSLSFSQTIAPNLVFDRNIRDDLLIVQSVSRNIIYERDIVQKLILPDDHYDRFISLLDYPIPLPVAVGTIDMAVMVLTGKYGSITLPTPEFDDSDGNIQSINVVRTTQGSTYTFVKSSDRRKLEYNFRISLAKSFELRAFLIANLSETFVIQDWKSNTWIAKFVGNPHDLEAEGRWSKENEVIRVDLEFEAVKV